QTDIQERHYIGPAAQHQFLVRSHLHRTLGGGWEVSAGMCVFLQNPNDPLATDPLTVPELRPHLESVYKQKLGRLTLDHRFRGEARFYHHTNAARTALEEGYAYSNLRFRYRLQASLRLWEIGENRYLKLKLSDEIHLNAARQGNVTFFDQNRIYAGISTDLSPNLNVDIGYLNWFQQRSSTAYFNRHIVSVLVYHRLGTGNS
ncbi:MAG: DUF2490 domain-containing protein, partial [Bacteroidetes bacterium]